MNTAADPDTPRCEHTGAIRVYLATRRALIDSGADPETALDVARALAERVEDAYQGRRFAFRADHLDAERLNRADIIHLFRCRFPWDGTETQHAESALIRIEAEIGVRFPEPTEQQRFFPTSLSVWDKITNSWACYGPDGCGAWTSGDGIKGLETKRCRCGNHIG